MVKLKYMVPGILLIWCLCVAGVSTAEGGKRENDLTVAKGARESVTVSVESGGKDKTYALALDEIGVVAAPSDNTKKMVLALQNKLGAVSMRSYEGRVYVLKLKSAMLREKLFGLALSLEGQVSVTHAGVPLYAEGAKIPIIATNSVIVQFRESVSEEEAIVTLAREGMEPIAVNPYVKARQVLARAKPDRGRDAISMGEKMSSAANVEFAYPDFIRVVDYRQFTPNDPLFANQWHHRNTGASGGTVDADGDTDFAWTITRGNAATVIAVLDNGFDMGHEDLTPNRWTNAGETAGNNRDDDGNGCVDDINGCSFATLVACTPGGLVQCGSGTVLANNHGTSVAGVAAARGHNSIGVSGACPNCTLIMIQQGATVFNDGLAIGFAGAVGAQVFTNSWGYPIGTAIPANVATAIANTAAAGTVIFWAMNNGNRNDCTGTPDISANPNAIAISASSNLDRKVTESAFGNCMELLSPTHRGYGPNPNGQPTGSGSAYMGTLNIVTTDRTGAAGYNNTAPQNSANGFDPTFCPAESAGQNYTFCFGGTSSATPYAAGVAGLMRSATPALTRQQVQRALQDTTDKIQDSAGAYSLTTGFSAPASGAATHGFGRINAFEAVRLVAPRASGGRGNVDVFLRDNRLDWGNTEQPSNVLMEPTRGFIPHYESADIKVDAGPDYQTPPSTSAQFDALVDESPVSGEINKVYVRVHNRGTSPAANVTVKVQWAFAGTALPALPADYWTVFPGDSTDPTSRWTTLGTQTISNLQYSGASVAGTATDASQILIFDFPGPPIDPAVPAFRHHCIFAVVSSPDDPVQPASIMQFAPDLITPIDNNVTHKNVAVQDPLVDGRFRAAFYVRNAFARTIETRLSITAPKGWKTRLEGLPAGTPFRLEAGSEKLVYIDIAAPVAGAVGRVEVRQSLISRQDPPQGKLRTGRERSIGGVVYVFRDPKEEHPDPKPVRDAQEEIEQPVRKRGD